MIERTDPKRIDWSVTTWEGSRRQQMERWATMSLDEILEAQDEMARLSHDLARQAGDVTPDAATVRDSRLTQSALGYSSRMTSRWADWFRQGQADLRHARHALAGGHHEWACFAAQQAAEKGLKAVHGGRGQVAWGHSVTELLESLREGIPGIDEAMLDRGRTLDKLYMATRYPNGLPAGAPTDYYTRAEGERAISDAEALLAWCERELPR